MQERYAVMLSWAVTLSGYPAPTVSPDVVPASQRYLMDEACGGRECEVMGWFPPGSSVY